ncbi:hypothetical protein PMAYCL1PPCAC_27147, partial [Pristionchus mayeri]
VLFTFRMISLRNLIFLLSTNALVFACTCRDQGPEAARPSSISVSKVKVDQVYELARNNHTYEILYTVKHLTTFKPAKTVLVEEIRTPPNDNMCGVRLAKGAEVVLAGSMTACGYLRIDSCTRIEPSFDTNKFKNINCSKLVII